MRAQNEQIASLLDHQRLLRSRHERMLASLPVGILTTDELGIVRSVNAAVAAHIGTSVGRILGKPVTSLFVPDDRPELCRGLSAGAHGGDDFRCAATLSAAATRVEVSGPPSADDDHRMTWMLLVSPTNGRAVGDPALPTALVRLTALPAQSIELLELLGAAAFAPRWSSHRVHRR